ncbi:MAG TPA: dihydroorotate dehydrogenase-like protein [Kiritimatiellia bacterium]|nr:dihydroorotate dehydrogenase-like protein [Kiritimatiellia bacterium]
MDLSTTYLGLKLKNPIIHSSSPLSDQVDNIRALEDAGAGAVVMFSIFEEQLRLESAALDHYTTQGADSFAESLSYFPSTEDYNISPHRYLDLVQRAAEAVDIPVIGSLNGISSEGWIDYAKQIQQAGADALELNIYFLPTDINITGAEIEDRYLSIAKGVRDSVSIPVAVKLNPFFSSIANIAHQLDRIGINGLVLFNRFIQPDIDLEELEVKHDLTLSTPAEIRLPLRWIAILYGRLGCSLAATRGVHSANEIIKYILAGADAVMTTAAVLKKGIPVIEAFRHDLLMWMERFEYDSIEQMKGALSQKSVADPDAFERAQYIRTLEHFKRHHASMMPW